MRITSSRHCVASSGMNSDGPEYDSVGENTTTLCIASICATNPTIVALRRTKAA